MLTNKLTSVNIIFAIHLTIVGLTVVGILPRETVVFWTVVLAAYVLWVSLEDSTAFFVRSIPFFVAIPITAGFDSFNMWRVLSGLIFIKWLTGWLAGTNPKFFRFPKFSKSSWYFLCGRIKSTMRRTVSTRGALFIAVCLLALAILSVIPAQNYILAIKRIIYFVNLSLIGIIISDLVKKNRDFSSKLIKNIAIPTIIVAVIGMVQQISTYYMDIFRFVDFWGGVVQRNMFGNAWAETAIKANTWFAYYGDQLSLRIFSIFPDTHSFPIFLLLGLPAVMAVALKRIIEKSPDSFHKMLKTRASILVVFVPIIFLAMILTGTRGIWVAGVISTVWAIFLIYRLRKSDKLSDLRSRTILIYITSYLILFFLLFGPAYYILATDQFQMAKDNTGLLNKRIRSVIDIAETSNARRLEIWNDSLRSIIKRPLLGVGIGNFPVVVGEDLARAKAGSSAHNLYLHIAAELGIPALLFALWFLWLLLKKLYSNFLHAYDLTHLRTIYFASLLIFLPWVLIYSLTDVAIFDERTFLLFVATLAIIFSQKENGQAAD